MHSDVLPECKETHKRYDDHIKEGERWRLAILGIIATFIMYVTGFVYLSGKFSAIVDKNTEQIWEKLTPACESNTVNIEKLMTKLENVKIIGYAQAEEIKK